MLRNISFLILITKFFVFLWTVSQDDVSNVKYGLFLENMCAQMCYVKSFNLDR
jgi:hypothetical protein